MIQSVDTGTLDCRLQVASGHRCRCGSCARAQGTDRPVSCSRAAFLICFFLNHCNERQEAGATPTVLLRVRAQHVTISKRAHTCVDMHADVCGSGCGQTMPSNYQPPKTLSHRGEKGVNRGPFRKDFESPWAPVCPRVEVK